LDLSEKCVRIQTHATKFYKLDMSLSFYHLKTIARQWMPPFCHHYLRKVFKKDVRISYRLGATLGKLGDYKVLSGPFAGMKYVKIAVGSAFTPKLMGTYELELRGCLDFAVEYVPDTIVDIGAAEGYYAIGMARKFPASNSIAFESTHHGQKLVLAMAELNQVSINVLGSCTAKRLNEVLPGSGKIFVICDCEGFEYEILSPTEVPRLRTALMLVEVHGREIVPPEAGETHTAAMCRLLIARFADSHETRWIPAVARTVDDLPGQLFGAASPSSFKAGMNEYRSIDSGWLWLVPLSAIENE